MTYEIEFYSRSRLLRRVYSGSGRRVSARNLLNAPRSVASAIRRRVLNRYDRLPFIPYQAIAALEARLFPAAVGVEVGAGMSTAWLGARTLRLTSYEWNDEWLQKVSRLLEEQKAYSVELVPCLEHEKMAFEAHEDGSLDFALIDGGPRSLCLRNLWPKVKKGGFVYLDNWDSDLFWTEGQLDAREFVKSRADEIEATYLFIDYTPLQFCVSEGLLIVKRH